MPMPEAAKRAAPYKMQVRHTDDSANVLYVFKWSQESKRIGCFQYAKGQLEFYKLKPIKMVYFYDNQAVGKPLVGTRTKEGIYTGEVEFMNYITPRGKR